MMQKFRFRQQHQANVTDVRNNAASIRPVPRPRGCVPSIFLVGLIETSVPIILYWAYWLILAYIELILGFFGLLTRLSGFLAYWAYGWRLTVAGWHIWYFLSFVSKWVQIEKKVRIKQRSGVAPQLARQLILSSHSEGGFPLIFIDFTRFSLVLPSTSARNIDRW